MDFSLFARQINTADVGRFLLVQAHQFSFSCLFVLPLTSEMDIIIS